jgi:hypothetical protein
MTKEEYDLIRRFARKYLFRKYHNDHLSDLTQYLALHKWQKPNYDLRFGVIDFCRSVGITMERANKKAQYAQQSAQMQDRYAVADEPLDVFGEIELKLIEKGAAQNQINEVLALLKEKDYSAALDCFRRIGLNFPVKYSYQRWPNSDKMWRFGSKIVKYLRENLC